MAGERLKALVARVGEAIITAEDYVTRLEERLEDLDEAMDQRLADLKSSMARLGERFTELEVSVVVDEDPEPVPEP